MARDHVHPTRRRAESHLVRSPLVRRRRPFQRLSLNGAYVNEPHNALEDASERVMREDEEGNLLFVDAGMRSRNLFT